MRAAAACGFGQLRRFDCVCCFASLLMQSFGHWCQAGWRDDSSHVKILAMNHVLVTFHESTEQNNNSDNIK